MSESKSFGKELLIDLYGVEPRFCDDIELCYRFLEELVDVLKMTKMCFPICMHGPKDKGAEVFPDKEGVTGFIGLIESSIVLHAIAPKNFISIDVYTCGEMEPETVIAFIKEKYKPTNIEFQLIERGIKY